MPIVSAHFRSLFFSGNEDVIHCTVCEIGSQLTGFFSYLRMSDTTSLESDKNNFYWFFLCKH